MKKGISLLIFFLLSIAAFAQMTDDQVLEYVKSEHAKGSSQQTIGASLLQKGVTQTQMERIKKQAEQQNQSTSASSKDKEHISDPDGVLRKKHPYKEIIRDEDGNILYADSLKLKKEGPEIFGKNIFNRKDLSFAPDVNIPTPIGYKLGAGDEVVIEIWGASQASIRKTISPDGTINIDNLGPLFLSGMTIEAANSYVKNKLASLYSGVDDSDGSSHIQLTLGQIRTIQVNVMGEVEVPGTYSLSSLSSVFHALYLAGGVNDIGSLREINLYRNSKKVASVDIYDFLLHGKTANDIRLFDGDVIIVPTHQSLVNISGKIKRPMSYEMKEDETVKNVIDYAGGFASGAYSDQINLVRRTGGYDKVYTLNTSEISSFTLFNGDSITIDKGLGLYDNRVEIIGNVFRPGYYQLGGNVTTIKSLIEKAGGLKEDAFLDRIIITRQKEDLTFRTIALNLRNILSGADNDIALKKEDVISISSQRIETDLGDLYIYGMVATPGAYEFAENTTIKDLIVKAGGLLSSASIAKVDVSRRLIDPASIENATILAETYTFSIENGLIVDGKDDFTLKPYDQVHIRKSPGYQVQRNVEIEGEILFPGTYTLERKEQRLSELITQAGGVTPHAFMKGAKLIRKQSEEELERQKQTLDVLNRGILKDSISDETLDTDLYYPIGIQLDKAISNPLSEYDIVLKPDDKLVIPEFDNTIKINGAVMHPNTVLYKKGEKLTYYIEQAGGYSDNAEKKRAYVVYMNGTVAKGKGSSKSLMQPGAEIIVPTKEKKEKMSTGEIIGISSSVVSMASVVALLVNSLSK